MWRLVDTNIVSYFVNRHSLATVYQPHIRGYDLAIAVQTLGELREGGMLANWGTRRWNQLETTIAPMAVYDATQEVSAWWA